MSLIAGFDFTMAIQLFPIESSGMNKASRGINVSGDISAGKICSISLNSSIRLRYLCLTLLLHIGFNSTPGRGNVTRHKYIQVGKGRDVGFNQISLFEAKVACGNGEQTLSRDIYRLGHCFDFFRMLSCYFTTVGFYINSMVMLNAYQHQKTRHLI